MVRVPLFESAIQLCYMPVREVFRVNLQALSAPVERIFRVYAPAQSLLLDAAPDLATNSRRTDPVPLHHSTPAKLRPCHCWSDGGREVVYGDSEETGLVALRSG